MFSGMDETAVCCGMTVKQMRILGVSVRKVKALTVKTETLMLVDKGREKLTFFV